MKKNEEDRRFGAGLLPWVPYAVLAEGFREPDEEDRAATGALFTDLANREPGGGYQVAGKPVPRQR